MATNHGDGTVRKVAKSGGEPRQLASAQASPSDIALMDGWLYWANSGNQKPDQSGNVPGAGIVRLQSSGGTPEALVAGTSPLRLAVSAAGLFWTNQDGTVRRAALDGSNQVVLAAQERPLDLALDGANVYWTNGFEALQTNEPRQIRAAVRGWHGGDARRWRGETGGHHRRCDRNARVGATAAGPPDLADGGGPVDESRIDGGPTRSMDRSWSFPRARSSPHGAGGGAPGRARHRARSKGHLLDRRTGQERRLGPQKLAARRAAWPTEPVQPN